MIKICPSTDPCDEEKLLDYVREMQGYGISFMHCDVMDGEFVDNKKMPIELISQISKTSQVGLDIHLMVKEPARVIDEYLNLPANYITVHYEAFKNKSDILKVIDKIHKKDILAGLSINPNTDVNIIKPFLPYIDLILVMSVVPGKSGQRFIERSLEKVKALKEFITQNKLRVKIEIDGGVNKDNIREIVASGIDMAVVGSALFNSDNRKNFIDYCHAINA